ncbi:MAG: hypothetical protein M3422_19490, partial [Actinomycetota bacterium]|nr:hypothetical protein [Actinomycetota bacterium]
SGATRADELNEALRAPVDAQVRYVRDSVAGIRQDMRGYGDERWDDPVRLDVEAEVLLQNERYVSVRYDNQPRLGLLSDSSWQNYSTVTVDLGTGEALTPDEVFRPGSAGNLHDVLVENEQVAACQDSMTGEVQLELTQEDLGESVLVAFTRDHASFTVELANLGGYTVCGTPIVDVPYDELTEVLDPALVDKLRAG